MKKFLIIQTSFIGDAILASSLLEKLHQHYPDAQIDLLVRKGNEGLYANHPFLKNLLVWDKKSGKYGNLMKILKEVRRTKYDHLINLQRFGATGILTMLSGAKERLGFEKNPFAFSFNKKFPHKMEAGIHEVDRNQQIIAHLTDGAPARPRLYPSMKDQEEIAIYQKKPYICLAPASVWFTKQLPREKWVELIGLLNQENKVFLLGSPGDIELCKSIKEESAHPDIEVLAGKLSLLQSAALMKGAVMNYVNDSAPLHLASAMNAPVTAFFCSTVTDFGFGPLSDQSFVIETPEKLNCRPCGIHGHMKCPKGHFKCGYGINLKVEGSAL